MSSLSEKTLDMDRATTDAAFHAASLYRFATELAQKNHEGWKTNMIFNLDQFERRLADALQYVQGAKSELNREQTNAN